MESSYEEFLAQLKEHCAIKKSAGSNNNNTDDQKVMTKLPKSVYEELSFDFPLLSPEELQGLASDMLNGLSQRSDETESSSTPQAHQALPPVFASYPIKRKFVQSIVEGASRYSATRKAADEPTVENTKPLSSDQATDVTVADSSKPSTTTTTVDQDSVDSTVTMTTAYSTLCAIVFVKMTQLLLKMSDEQRVQAMREYKCHSFTTSKPRFGDLDENIDWNPTVGSSPESDHQNGGEDEEVVVQEGGSDSDYESYDVVPQSGSLMDALVGGVGDDDDEHDDADKNETSSLVKVIDMIQTEGVTYEVIAGPEGVVWNRFDLGSEVISLARIISSCDDVTVRFALLPMYLFMLRDRMLANFDSIPDLLPTCLSVLRVKSTDEKEDQAFRNLREQIAISIISALASHANNSKVKSKTKENQAVLVNTIEDCLPFIAKRTNAITQSKTLSNPLQNELEAITHVIKYLAFVSDQEESLLKSGLFRDAIQIVLKHPLEAISRVIRELLLQLCARYTKLCSWAAQVPKLLQIIESKDFVNLFRAEAFVWSLVFTQPFVDKNVQNRFKSQMDTLLDLSTKEKATIEQLKQVVHLLTLLKAVKEAAVLKGDKANSVIGWFETPNDVSKAIIAFCSQSGNEENEATTAATLETRDVQKEKELLESVQLRRRLRALQKDVFIGTGKRE
eukprot:TRINITY_DN5279_c0_g4_i1.p1 TRINITY_DN5279_c0_g4~~TRINITY_DN5279_c0_g4_i1.p1  ORF type:complete len:677 (+),score=172.23 TRINITY_DN5279_c0_g4_i1:174-2204(+)